MDGITTKYCYDNGQVKVEKNEAGTITAVNHYGITLYARVASSAGYYYLYNAHKDIVMLLDSVNGSIAATYDYDAFGNVLAMTGDANNNFTYGGYQYDAETGLYYLNARYYDSTTARFLTEDTYLGQRNDPLSLNLYTYCSNNPIRYFDPSGHKKKDSEILNSQGLSMIDMYKEQWKDYNKQMKNCKDKNSEKYKSLKEKRDLQHDLADQVRNEEIFSITYIVKAPVVKDTSSMTNKEMLECLGFVSSESETRDYDSKRVAQSSALIVTQWFGTEWFSGVTVNGKMDDKDTREVLEFLLENGITADMILYYALDEKKWYDEETGKPEYIEIPSNAQNGELDTTDMVYIPSQGNGYAKTYKPVAIAWAMMVQTAAKEKEFELDFFLITGEDSGYRSLDVQKQYKKDKGASAAAPGTSNHGWGLALDFSRRMGEDEKVGIAHSFELKWLEANASTFGFRPLLDTVTPHIVVDNKTVNYYYESWHWVYYESNKNKKK